MSGWARSSLLAPRQASTLALGLRFSIGGLLQAPSPLRHSRNAFTPTSEPAARLAPEQAHSSRNALVLGLGTSHGAEDLLLVRCMSGGGSGYRAGVWSGMPIIPLPSLLPAAAA